MKRYYCSGIWGSCGDRWRLQSSGMWCRVLWWIFASTPGKPAACIVRLFIIQVSERKGDVVVSSLVWDLAPTFEYVKGLTQSCKLECCVTVNCQMHKSLVTFHVSNLDSFCYLALNVFEDVSSKCENKAMLSEFHKCTELLVLMVTLFLVLCVWWESFCWKHRALKELWKYSVGHNSGEIRIRLGILIISTIGFQTWKLTMLYKYWFCWWMLNDSGIIFILLLLLLLLCISIDTLALLETFLEYDICLTRMDT